MYERKIPVNPECGLDLLREIISGKWKISLLYFISQGTNRPSQLHKRLSSGSPRVLNMQLRQLAEHGLIYKQALPNTRVLAVEYNLTALGLSLTPLLVALGNWGDEHQEELRGILTSG